MDLPSKACPGWLAHGSGPCQALELLLSKKENSAYDPGDRVFKRFFRFALLVHRFLLFKGLTANAADRDTDGDVEAEAKGEAEAEDQQVLIATLDLQGECCPFF